MEEMSAHLYDFFWIATGRVQDMVFFFPQFRMAAETFAILNIGFVTLILASVPFLNLNHGWARKFAWFWAVVEIINGIGHLSVVIAISGYVPGAISAPLLIITGIVLIRRLRRYKPRIYY